MANAKQMVELFGGDIRTIFTKLKEISTKLGISEAKCNELIAAGLLTQFGDLETLKSETQASDFNGIMTYLVRELNVLKNPTSPAVTKAEMDGAISAAVTKLVGGAPEAMDTLGELVEALNAKGSAGEILSQQGALSSLSTTAKNNLVAAINEVVSTLTSVSGSVSSLTGKVNTIESEVNTVKSKLDTEVATLKNADITAQSSLTQIRDANATLGTTVSGLSGKVTTLEGETGRLSTQQGTLSSLTTTAKDSLVSGINEVVTSTNSLTEKVTQLTGKQGSLESLTTTNKASLVDAVNEVKTSIEGVKTELGGKVSTIEGKVSAAETKVEVIGSLNDLTTTKKDNLVVGINEVVTSTSALSDKVGQLTNKQGELNNLTTLNKTSLVDAINEVKNSIPTAAPSGQPSSELDTKVANLEKGVTQLSGQQGSLSNLTTTAKTTLVDAVNETKSSIDNVSTTLGSRITTLESGVNTSSSSIGGLSGRLSVVENDVGGIKTDINSVKGTNATLTTSVSQLTSKTSVLEGEVSALKNPAIPPVTKSQLDSAISTATAGLVDGAPESLNTIGKLASALNSKGDESQVLRQQGSLNNLTTTVKDSLVAAINEVKEATETLERKNNSQASLIDYNRQKVGDLGNKTTALESDVNNIKLKQGSLGSLTTDAKTTFVDAINEIKTSLTNTGLAITRVRDKANDLESTLNSTNSGINNLSNRVTVINGDLSLAKTDITNLKEKTKNIQQIAQDVTDNKTSVATLKAVFDPTVDYAELYKNGRGEELTL